MELNGMSRYAIETNTGGVGIVKISIFVTMLESWNRSDVADSLELLDPGKALEFH